MKCTAPTSPPWLCAVATPKSRCWEDHARTPHSVRTCFSRTESLRNVDPILRTNASPLSRSRLPPRGVASEPSAAASAPSPPLFTPADGHGGNGPSTPREFGAGRIRMGRPRDSAGEVQHDDSRTCEPRPGLEPKRRERRTMDRKFPRWCSILRTKHLRSSRPGSGGYHH